MEGGLLRSIRDFAFDLLSISRPEEMAKVSKLRMDFLVKDESGILKAPTNRLKYKDIKLSNGLRCILISDPKSEDDDQTTVTSEGESETNDDKPDDIEAAAAMCVNVGSLEDPHNVQGLAHLMEHVLTMGSEKYPDENGFDNFLGNITGTSNACTTLMQTTFDFECPKKHMREALDQFAHYFIKPLLRQSSIEREVNPVDTEFLESTSKDDHRLEQFMTILTKKGHPLKCFSWGNKVSLIDRTREAGIDLREELVKFYKQYYRAENMCLAVQAQTDFDTLESWVKVFEHIPNGCKEPADMRPTRITTPPYDESLHHRVYYIKPVHNTHRLHISWSLPPALAYYKVKPLDYLSAVIGHEGKGSVASYLKKQGWAMDISAGNDLDCGSNCHHNKFTIDISLTEEGLQKMGQVVRACFVYIKMLRGKGPEKQIYDEEALINQNDVRFEEETSPNDSTKDIAKRSFFYNREHLLLGSRLYMEYEDKVINDYLQKLVPKDANFIIFSYNLLKEHEYTKQEPWMQIPYKCTKVPKDWLIEDDAEIAKNFDLPEPNKFIPKKFSLVQGEGDTLPKDIITNQSYKLWFSKNVSFKSPKTLIYFVLKSPAIQDSVQMAIALDMFLGCLSLNMSEDIYPATNAGIMYNVYISETGLVFQYEGWSEVMEKFVDLFMVHLSDFKVQTQTFKAVKDKLKRTYTNTILDPERLGRGLKFKVLEPFYYSASDKLCVIDSFTMQDLKKQIDKYFSVLFMEILIQGNIHGHEAKEMAHTIRKSLAYKVLDDEKLRELQTYRLPTDHDTFLRVAAFDSSAKHSFISNFYQLGKFDFRDFCRLELFSQFMFEHAFDFLRTKHSLGYSVYSAQHNIFGYGAFSLTVLSPADKFSCSEVESKMEEFLHQEFLPAIVAMPESTFKEMVASLIEQKGGPDMYLKEEVDRNWHEIMLGNYVFDRLEHEIRQLKKVTQPEFIRWSTDIIKNYNSRQKLSIQVVGFGEVAMGESRARNPRLKHSNVNELKYMWPKNGSSCDKRANYIDSISDFQKTLTLNPVHKTVE